MTVNIDANVGAIDKLEYQNNGTERLKGSYPRLIKNENEILNHLELNIPKVLEQNPSRLCSRYFVANNVIENINQIIDDQVIENFELKVEAKIPLENMYWVWIGGNVLDRMLDPKLEKEFLEMINKKPEKELKTYFDEVPKNYVFKMLGTKERLKFVDKSTLPKFVEIEEINEKYAREISKLYEERMPIYVAPNHDPEYTLNTVADSKETYLLVAINKNTDTVEAAMTNEFTQYPLDNSVVHICESNDWVKKRGKETPREVMYALLDIGMINAMAHNIDGIEIECVPESIKMAKEIAGADNVEYFLKRTSYMVTDGKNIENTDTTIPKDFRKFSSLFLFYLSPKSLSWKFWKNISEKTLQK